MHALSFFWAEAASTACFVINRSPSRAIEKKTLIDLWSGEPAGYTDLKSFGCPAYAREARAESFEVCVSWIQTGCERLQVIEF